MEYWIITDASGRPLCRRIGWFRQRIVAMLFRTPEDAKWMQRKFPDGVIKMVSL